MAAETEALKLPKPIPVATELLNFAGDRRLDFLGFVRPDEVQEIKAYNIDKVSIFFFIELFTDLFLSS